MGDTAGNDPAQLEREALSIKSELGGANLEQTRSLLNQLKQLQNRIPMGGRKGRRSSSVIATAIVQAEQQLELQETATSWRSSEAMPVVLQVALYAGMTVAQKDFYNEIEKKAEYNLTAVKANGRLDTAGEQTISGAALREHFSVLKFHSLKEGEKRDLLSRAFGTEQPDEDAPKGKEQLKAEQEELKSIRHALRDMEAYKAYMLLVHSGLGVREALAEIARNRRRFAKALSDVEALHTAYDELQEAPDDGMLKARLALARRNMKQSLKSDIIDGVLAEDTDGKDEREPCRLLPPGALCGWVLGR